MMRAATNMIMLYHNHESCTRMQTVAAHSELAMNANAKVDVPTMAEPIWQH